MSHDKYVVNHFSIRNAVLLHGCHGQGKKSGKWIFFQVREKSGNFFFSQGNLEKMIKVREKSGNLKSFKKSQLVKKF